MGAVWLGRDEVLGRAVALKRIGVVPGADSPDLQRAEREARLAARLNHPHVVAVFDLVTEGDEQWLVMEYVEGMTLSQKIKQDGALAPDDAAPLLWQVADALAAAHSAGIVHRDVKPSNILVSPTGQAKLSDFGIARAEADATLTQTGLVTGSPAYLAPEVASGGTATDASDVWSLGATLFHVLAGHPPYEVSDNLLGALYRIVHEDPPRLSDAGWLAPLLEATMTREPRDRWSMAQVRDYLDAGPSAAGTAAEPVAGGAADSTRVLRPVVLPPPPAEVAPAEVEIAAEDGVHRRHGPFGGGAGRFHPAAVLVAVALVVLVAVILWAAFSGGDPNNTADRNPGKRGSSSQSSPRTTSQGPTADGMKGFITDYLSTVTSDPGTTWQRLTPAFQAQSGGFDGYQSFWGTIASAKVVSANADPGAMTVSYEVEYTKADGSMETDDVTLALVYEDGSYKIAGES